MLGSRAPQLLAPLQPGYIRPTRYRKYIGSYLPCRRGQGVPRLTAFCCELRCTVAVCTLPFIMADLKTQTAMQQEERSSSDVDMEKRHAHERIHGAALAEDLDALDNPDAGKSAEERAAIVRQGVKDSPYLGH